MDLTRAQWRTSSFSQGNNASSCVEVAFLREGVVAVRDTKDRSLAPQVHTASAWTSFLTAVRAGEFGHP
ncbi:MAG TPA: DUF397 domain-containing protein [Pseudonocardia sp.]|nr:DUF397 domain-containing protein [Pseudonocardia sp.]